MNCLSTSFTIYREFPLATVTLVGGVAVVLFATDADPGSIGTGFILEFEGNPSGGNVIGNDYVVFAAGGAGHFPAAGNYLDNQLSIIVFRPPGDVEDLKTLTITLTPDIPGSAIQPECFDSLRVFSFLSFVGGLDQAAR